MLELHYPPKESIDKVREEVLRLLNRNEYNKAVQYVRTVLMIGLIWAKDIVDEINRNYLGVANPSEVSKKLEEIYNTPSGIIKFIEDIN